MRRGVVVSLSGVRFCAEGKMHRRSAGGGDAFVAGGRCWQGVARLEMRRCLQGLWLVFRVRRRGAAGLPR